MAISGNKGEWSEIYTLFKLLGEGKIHAGDADMNKLDLYCPILNIIREEAKLYEYRPDPEKNIVVIDEDGNEYVRILADCLLEDSKPGASSSIKNCVAEVAKRNPLGFSGSNVEAFYEHKMKVLLVDSALGMTPSDEWTGRYDANGGYIVVRKDGEIVCYHFYNRNDIEDYLYNNTRFERASRSRYNFGSLYRGEEGGIYIKLNLQIRFKN